MKAKHMEEDCIAVQRYNCLFAREDIENWKKWFAAVQKPLDYILAAALILAGSYRIIYVFGIICWKTLDFKETSKTKTGTLS